jgi:hypothetical protein
LGDTGTVFGHTVFVWNLYWLTDPQPTKTNSNEARDFIARVAAPSGQDPDGAQWKAARVQGGTVCERLVCAPFDVDNDESGSTAVYISQPIASYFLLSRLLVQDKN